MNDLIYAEMLQTAEHAEKLAKRLERLSALLKQNGKSPRLAAITAMGAEGVAEVTRNLRRIAEQRVTERRS